MKVVSKQGRSYSKEEFEILNSEDYIFKCSSCKEDKPNKEFYKIKRKDPKRRRYYTHYCKKCRCKIQVHNRASLSESHRRYMLKREYGLSYETYLEMYDSQKGLCGICKNPESVLGKRLCVDHCHDTGKIRGLLCSTCNAAIGLLNDNIDRVKQAAVYLEKHNQLVYNAK